VKIILKGATAEITEKKSRFIATVQSVRSQEEADDFILRTRKTFWDARHNCSAMILGQRGEISRCSDDGEPSGTAGRPMLSVLAGEELTDVCAVVTRYFGGVLLGTGGLVRAYSDAVKKAVAACLTGTRTEGIRLRIRTSYNDAGKIRYILEQRQLPLTDVSYTDMVETETLVELGALDSLKKAVTEKTGAKADFPLEDRITFALTDQGPVLL
jgi:uncharacterized YigZ family protein